MKFLRLILPGLFIVQLWCACEPVKLEQEVRCRIYNSLLIEKELLHLEDMKPSEEVELRKSQLNEGLQVIAKYNTDLVYLGVIPPLPCPGRIGEHCFPGDPNLEGIVIGAMSNQVKESSAQFVDLKSGELVAEGYMHNYDDEFLTAWFKFKVVNADMVTNELMLKVNTVVDSDNGHSVINLEDIIPAETFSK